MSDCPSVLASSVGPPAGFPSWAKAEALRAQTLAISAATRQQRSRWFIARRVLWLHAKLELDVNAVRTSLASSGGEHGMAISYIDDGRTDQNEPRIRRAAKATEYVLT